jgi:hypothetical protein
MLRSAKPALCRPFGVLYATQPDANESRTFRTFDHYYAQRNRPSTVPEAARVLGVTVEAVRRRMHRGRYTKEKTAKGRVFVRLAPKQLAEAPEHADARSATHTPHVRDQVSLIEELRDQNTFLRRELEARTQEIGRRDNVITQLSQRVETIEASQPIKGSR